MSIYEQFHPRVSSKYEDPHRIAPSFESMNKTRVLKESEETFKFFQIKFTKDSNFIQDKFNLIEENFKKRARSFEVDPNATGDMFTLLWEHIKGLHNYLTKSEKFLSKKQVEKCSYIIRNYTVFYNGIFEVVFIRKFFDLGDANRDRNIRSKDVLWPERSRLDYLERKSFTVNTIAKKKNEYIFRDGRVLDTFDVNLLDLTNCFVELQGHITSLRIFNVVDCVILAGPVKFSIYAEKCRNTKLALCCEQLRLHDSTLCSIFLHFKKRAIMELCTLMSFGGYNYYYPELNRYFEASNIHRGEMNFKKIIDFDWKLKGRSANVKYFQSNLKLEWWNMQKAEFQLKLAKQAKRS